MTWYMKGFCEDLIGRLFPAKRIIGLTVPEIKVGWNYVDVNKLVENFLRKNFDPRSSSSMEHILYLLEEMTANRINFHLGFEEYRGNQISFTFGDLKYYVGIMCALRWVKHVTGYNSGVAWFSEKLKEHIDQRSDEVKELYKKAWDIHSLLPIYIFMLHRISHYNTSGKKGGKIDYQNAIKIFRYLYRSLLELLKERRIQYMVKLPQKVEKAFKLFQEKEPENIFKEYFGL